jgi:hypothetical protein
MVDILIDRTNNNKRHTLHRCFKCDHQKYPRGKVIMPYDKHAIHTKTTHICGTCAMEMNRKILDGMNGRRGILDD